MGFGVRVWDGSGGATPGTTGLILDANDRLPGVFGVYPFSVAAGATSPGPITVSTPGTVAGTMYALTLQDVANVIVNNNSCDVYFFSGVPTQAFSDSFTVFSL